MPRKKQTDAEPSSEETKPLPPVKRKNYLAISDFEKHETNPFAQEAIEKVQKVTVRKSKVAGADKSAQHIITNSETGELDGYAQFVHYVEVDEEKFTKLYIAEFASFYELNKPAMKVLHYIISNIRKDTDRFHFRMKKCIEFTGYSKFSIFNGVGSLIKNGIIARTDENDEFFINPMVLFNGDRIAYVRTYVKKK